MKYYPLYLEISNRKCVVAGGGEVAERKVARLLECGARVVVIGKFITPRLEALKEQGALIHIADDYRHEYIEDAFLVIGATDSEDVNEKIYRDSSERNIPVNIVDDPVRCSFIVPSVFQQGDITMAISTGGKSPALAKRLRKDLEQRYGSEYEVLLNIMGNLREKIIARGLHHNDNKILFESILDSNILSSIREKNWEKVRKTVKDLVGEDITIGA